MITFICALVILFLGYFLYGKLAERVFKPDDRLTPAMERPDGVDCVPMKTWRVFMIQLLNIAGTGPIFGALLGAVFGPVVFLWIVFGSILGGAVHDYMSGMISVRMNGASLSEIIGKYLGGAAKQFMRVFSVFLMILVGAVFTKSPAELLARITPSWANTAFWIAVILAYYILATLLPIDKLIGKFYPLFGGMLILMAVGIVIGLFVGGYQIPEMQLANLNPKGTPVFPFMFVTVACGAISGFHATQSPMMARCIQSERQGRRVFYGAMIVESIIALVWAAAGVAFYETTGGLQNALANLGQSGVVYGISIVLLGTVGGELAIIGVVVCPISTGDTAFRSARLTVADWFKIDQSRFIKQFAVTIPLVAASTALTLLNVEVIWRYLSWCNQTFAVFTLWAEAMYLVRNAKKRWYSLMCALPVAFMTSVCTSYILMADEGFKISSAIAYPIGISLAAVCTVLFTVKSIKAVRKVQQNNDT
ncbi:MAG: carbon starvation protein A [Oscillospiraceae bacterium]|nr:carbon starvation protein A [Oscillospiraceae bacterium]